MISSARLPWPPRWWAAGVAWALWTLAVLGLAATAWLDQLLRQAGRPELAQLRGGGVAVVLSAASAATAGAVLASRRPRHPSAGCWSWACRWPGAACPRPMPPTDCWPAPALSQLRTPWPATDRSPSSPPRPRPALPCCSPPPGRCPCPLALVGQGRPGRRGRLAAGAGVARGRSTPVPGARWAVRRSRPGWGAAGRQPARPGPHHPGGGGRGGSLVVRFHHARAEWRASSCAGSPGRPPWPWWAVVAPGGVAVEANAVVTWTISAGVAVLPLALGRPSWATGSMTWTTSSSRTWPRRSMPFVPGSGASSTGAP